LGSVLSRNEEHIASSSTTTVKKKFVLSIVMPNLKKSGPGGYRETPQLQEEGGDNCNPAAANAGPAAVKK
jgi:hypothetical protein